MTNTMKKQNRNFVEIIFWDKSETETESVKFGSEAEALAFVKGVAGSGRFAKYNGWSLSDSNYRFIIEVGEEIIPLH